MKKALQGFALLLFGLVLALIILEVLSRIFWEKWSELGDVSSISIVSDEDYKKLGPRKYIWPGHKGDIREFINEVNLNSYGVHDVEHSLAKPEKVFRIVVLGDSFTEAREFPVEKIYPRLLEADLKARVDFPVEVISLARSGNGAGEAYRALESLGLRFGPDLVIYQFLSNDLIDDDLILSQQNQRELELRRTYVLPLGEIYPRFLLVKGSRFNQLIALKLARLYQGFEVARYAHLDKYEFVYLNALIFADEDSAMWREAWKSTEASILRMKDLSKKRGASFAVVSFVEEWRVGKLQELERKMRAMNRRAPKYHWDFSKTDRILGDFCKENLVHFLSLLPAFKMAYQATGKKLHFAYEGHLNERGHAVAAKAIADYLINKGLIHQGS
jgi:lysophospholipase L1-like esterase